jgi:multidrug efflux pump subunit AcrA (membrane-fusion protein)
MKQILWRKIAFLTLLSAIVSGSLAMGFTGKLPSEPQDKVKTLTSPDGERTNLPEASVLEGTGKVVPKKAFSIASEVSGKIEKLSIRMAEGISVKEGEIICEIDPREHRLALDNLKAQIALLTSEEARIEQEQTSGLANLKMEEAKVRLSAGDLERRKRLLESGALSQSELDRKEMEHLAIVSSFQAQKSALKLWQIQNDAIKARKVALQSELDLAGLKLEKTKVRAPISGLILGKHVEQGQYLQVGQPIATIVDATSLEVEVMVPFEYLAMLAPSRAKLPCHSQATSAEAVELVDDRIDEVTVQLGLQGHEFTWKGNISRIKPV